jgi:hypothetical protein
MMLRLKRKMRPGHRKLPLAEIGLALTAFALGFGIIELSVAKLMPIHSFLYQFRPERISFVPGSVGRIVLPKNYNVRFVANNLGYHDFDRTVDKTRSRMIVIGDSFVEAVQIQDEKDLFTSLIEKRIQQNAAHHGSWEVMSMGMSGQGTAQYSILYERYAKNFRPDIVVIVTVYNDFWNNLFVLPRYEISGEGEFTLLPGSESHISKPKQFLLTILRQWDTYHAFRTLPLIYKQKQVIKKDPEAVRGARLAEGRFPDRRLGGIPENQWHYYKTLLLRMKCLVEGDGAKFLQVVVDTARLNAPDPISAEIMKICHGYSMECLSLRPKFKEEFDRSGQTGRWEGDGHWNGLGHRLVAEALFSRLEKLNWLGDGPPRVELSRRREDCL